jgi:hypothetical protein
MPFTVENKEHSIIKFTITETVVQDDLTKILGIISRVFETNKHFAFIVHIDIQKNPATSEVPSMIKYLVTWMKNNKHNITKTLMCTSLVIKSQVMVNIVNTVFRLQPTIKPNLITTEYEKAEKFVTDIMKEFLSKHKR